MGQDFSYLEEKMLALMEQDWNKAEQIRKEFYPDGQLPREITYSSTAEPVQMLLNKARQQSPASKPVLLPSQSTLQEQCFTIQDNVRQGNPGCAELMLDQGSLFINRKSYSLGKTLIKMRSIDGDVSPSYIYLKKDSTLDIRILLSEDLDYAIMAVIDEDKNDFYIRLAECHVLSMQEDSDPNKEIGLIVSYIAPFRKVCFSIIMAQDLSPIKELLLSDMLLSGWEKAKESDVQSEPFVEEDSENGET